MKLTVPEIAYYARAAGFAGSALVMATAVAVRESGGNTDAVGDVDRPHAGCRSYGLMQINVCPQGTAGGNNAGIPWREQPSTLLDPGTNMAAAFSLSRAGSAWGPWSTAAAAATDTGHVEQTIRLAGGPTAPAGVQPVSGSPGLSTPGGSTPSSGGLDGLVHLGATLADPKTWLRAALLAAGGVVTVVGVILLTRDSQALHGAASAVSDAVPGGPPS